MENTHELDYKEIHGLLNRLVEKKVNAIIDNLGIEVSLLGEIVSVDSIVSNEEGEITEVFTASVKLTSGDIVRDIKNTTGEILRVGDVVKIFGSRTNISNRYIGARFKGGV